MSNERLFPFLQRIERTLRSVVKVLDMVLGLSLCFGLMLQYLLLGIVSENGSLLR